MSSFSTNMSEVICISRTNSYTIDISFSNTVRIITTVVVLMEQEAEVI